MGRKCRIPSKLVDADCIRFAYNLSSRHIPAPVNPGVLNYAGKNRSPEIPAKMNFTIRLRNWRMRHGEGRIRRPGGHFESHQVATIHLNIQHTNTIGCPRTQLPASSNQCLHEAKVNYRTTAPDSLSAVTNANCPARSSAINSMPWLSRPIILRGARLATTTTRQPTRVHGSKCSATPARI